MTEDEYTNQDFMLNVGDGHRLHIVDWGNQESTTPFIFLHGGPGGAIKDRHKLFFNPEKHRVIFFDQRGCGASTPQGSLNNNRTDLLANDITKIADHLKLDQFSLYGYSWGSTLALYYSINNPSRVQNLIIGGVFSGDNDLSQMIDRLRAFFPEVYEKVLHDIPEEHHANLAKYLQETAQKGTPAKAKKACYTLETIEFSIANYNSDRSTPGPYEDFDPNPTRIENHYLSSNCFLPKNYLVQNAHKITARTFIVQGRSDLVCLPEYAYRIHQQIPNSKLYWTNSNHYSERELVSVVRTIIDLVV